MDNHCLWDQLHYQRSLDGDRVYLENLEAEWASRNLCSRCLLDLGAPFAINVDQLQRRAETAEARLRFIGELLSEASDNDLRREINDALDGGPV